MNAERANVIRGASLMVAAACCFALMSALIRLGSAELHPFQIAFFRNAIGLCFMLPWLARGNLATLKTTRIGLYWIRALLGAGTMLIFFWTLSILPLAEVVSLSFTTPLFVTMGAAWILHETVGIRRWSATLIGFAGTLIILRPGLDAVSLPAVMVLISAAAMAGSVLIIKVLSRTENSNAIVLYMGLMMTPISFLVAIWFWQWPSLATWGILIGLGAAGTLGHVCFTRAIQIADASLVMPFDFVRLPVVAMLGWLLFNQTVDAFTWIGAVIIFSAGVYIAHRETRVSKHVELPHSLGDP